MITCNKRTNHFLSISIIEKPLFLQENRITSFPNYTYNIFFLSLQHHRNLTRVPETQFPRNCVVAENRQRQGAAHSTYTSEARFAFSAVFFTIPAPEIVYSEPTALPANDDLPVRRAREPNTRFRSDSTGEGTRLYIYAYIYDSRRDDESRKILCCCSGVPKFVGDLHTC